MPRLSYIVCSTPRSGSTLLCELLKSTGVAGRPEEYFEARAATGLPPHPGDYLEGLPPTGAGVRDDETPPEPAPYSDLRGIEDYGEHLETSFRLGTTDNGVFGTKLMWRNLDDLCVLAGALPPYARLDTHELLERVFESPRYVWMTRREKARQAISLWRALQTRTWRQEHPGPSGGAAELVYSFEAIDHLARALARDDDCWRQYLADHAEATIAITYEDDVEGEERQGTIERILQHLDIAAPQGWRAEAPLRRQADELTEQWVAQYRHEREQRMLTSSQAA